MESLITTYWPLLTTAAGITIWLVRLEGLTKQNAKDIDRVEGDLKTLRASHEMLDSKVVEQLAQVRESLARIEGYLGVKKVEK